MVLKVKTYTQRDCKLNVGRLPFGHSPKGSTTLYATTFGTILEDRYITLCLLRSNCAGRNAKIAYIALSSSLCAQIFGWKLEETRFLCRGRAADQSRSTETQYSPLAAGERQEYSKKNKRCPFTHSDTPFYII